jgi:hypothetical protein
MRFHHPSPELPPYPAFEIEIPDGWRPDEAPDCLGVFYDPEAVGFVTNVLLSADRVAADVDLETAARTTLEEASEFAEYQVEQEHVVDVDGQPASLRWQSFSVEGVEDRLLQMQVLFFAPANGRSKTHDLFHIDGTCLAGDAERYATVFQEIARSFRFVK